MNKEIETNEHICKIFCNKIALSLPPSNEVMKAIRLLNKELPKFLTTHTNKKLDAERERCLNIVMDRNHELENWYMSSLRPDNFDFFNANQRNMKTRNEITYQISNPEENIITNHKD